MKRALLFVIACAALFAQKPKPDAIESCGLGSGHHCHCKERTDNIQTAALAFCNAPGWRDHYKTQEECYRERLHGLDHCSIAERSTDYDQYAGDAELQDGHLIAKSSMGAMCSMACKKHDCKCDDGPTCHFGHTAADHK